MAKTKNRMISIIILTMFLLTQSRFVTNTAYGWQYKAQNMRPVTAAQSSGTAQAIGAELGASNSAKTTGYEELQNAIKRLDPDLQLAMAPFLNNPGIERLGDYISTTNDFPNNTLIIVRVGSPNEKGRFLELTVSKENNDPNPFQYKVTNQDSQRIDYGYFTDSAQLQNAIQRTVDFITGAAATGYQDIVNFILSDPQIQLLSSQNFVETSYSENRQTVFIRFFNPENPTGNYQISINTIPATSSNNEQQYAVTVIIDEHLVGAPMMKGTSETIIKWLSGEGDTTGILNNIKLHPTWLNLVRQATTLRDREALRTVERFNTGINVQNLGIEQPEGGRLNETLFVVDLTDPENPVRLFVLQKINTVFGLTAVDNNVRTMEEAQDILFPMGVLPEYYQKVVYCDVKEDSDKLSPAGKITKDGYRLMRYIGAPLDGQPARQIQVFQNLEEVERRFPGQGIQVAKEIGRTIAYIRRLLNALPGNKYMEPLPGFHDTGAYLDCYDALFTGQTRKVIPSANPVESPEIVLIQGIAEDPSVQALIQKYNEKRNIYFNYNQETGKWISVIDGFGEDIVDNDTKINNFIFIEINGQLHCIAKIDLDTIQKGRTLDDIGDGLRSAANPAGEDPKRLDDVHIDMDTVNNIVNAFIEKTRELYGDAEAERLSPQVYNAVLVYYYELGLRFFLSYLTELKTPNQAGDKKTHGTYFGNGGLGNLHRAQVQMRALEEMEKELQQRGIPFGFEAITHTATGTTTTPTVADAKGAANAAGIPYVERILVMEQNEGVRQAVRQVLRASGFADENIILTDGGENTESVLSLIESNKPDFILAGANNGRGTELAERLDNRFPLLLMSSNFEPASDATRTIASIYSGRTGVHGIIAKEDLTKDTFASTATNAVDNWLRLQAAKRVATVVTGKITEENSNFVNTVVNALQNLGFGSVYPVETKEEAIQYAEITDLTIDLTGQDLTALQQILGITNASSLMAFNNEIETKEIEQRIKDWLATQA